MLFVNIRIRDIYMVIIYVYISSAILQSIAPLLRLKRSFILLQGFITTLIIYLVLFQKFHFSNLQQYYLI